MNHHPLLVQMDTNDKTADNSAEKRQQGIQKITKLFFLDQ